MRDNTKNKNLFQKGINHPRWALRPTYLGVHKWLYREYGLATHCEYKHCVYPRKNASRTLIKKPKRFEWANLTRKYLRNRSDWVMLCPSDHAKFDRGLITLK